MKKTIIIALTLILVLASFTSCENNIHEHTWDKGTVTKAATCTEKGVKTYTCTVCKETKTEDIAIDPENHTWNEGEVTTPATCTEAGVKTFTCNGCKKTKTETIEALGHNLEEKIEPAGFLTKGSKKTICSICNYEEESIEIETMDISGVWLKSSQNDICYYFVFQTENNNGTIYFSWNEPVKINGSNYFELMDARYPFKASINDEKNQITIVEYSSQDETKVINTQYCEIFETIVNGVSVITIKDLTAFGKTTNWTLTHVPAHTVIGETKPEEIWDSSPTQHIKGFICTDKHEEGNPKYVFLDNYTMKEHEIETKSGYLTKGVYNCSVCGFKGDIPVTSLENTKWLSTAPVSAPSNPYINDLYLQIEFIDNEYASISVKESVDSSATPIESGCSYDVQFDAATGAATINIKGALPENYGGPATEDLQTGLITINIEAFNVGNLTFRRIIEE